MTIEHAIKIVRRIIDEQIETGEDGNASLDQEELEALNLICRSAEFHL